MTFLMNSKTRYATYSYCKDKDRCDSVSIASPSHSSVTYSFCFMVYLNQTTKVNEKRNKETTCIPETYSG